MVGHQAQKFSRLENSQRTNFRVRVPLRRRSLVICNALNKCAK